MPAPARAAVWYRSGASGVVEHDDPQTPWTWAASSRDPYGTAEIRQVFPTMMKDKPRVSTSLGIGAPASAWRLASFWR